MFERNARSPLTVKRRASTSGSRGSEQDFPRLNENRNIVCAETNETECGRRRPSTRLATARRRRMQGSRENGKGQNRASTFDATKVALCTRANTAIYIYIHTYACIHGIEKERKEEKENEREKEKEGNRRALQ